jgi:hypothetical protein
MAIRGIASGLPARGKKLLKEFSGIGGKDPSGNGRMVIKTLFGEQVHDAATGATLWIGRAIDDPRDARMHDGPRAHGAGLKRHVEIAAG